MMTSRMASPSLRNSGSRDLGRRTDGFSMMELMIVMAIVGILLAFALPSYTAYVERARRTEGKNFIARVQAAQERFYTNNSVYSANMAGAGNAGLGFPDEVAPDGFYRVGIALTNNGRGYLLTLEPEGTFVDSQCATMTIDNLGNKAATGPGAAKCW